MWRGERARGDAAVAAVAEGVAAGAEAVAE